MTNWEAEAVAARAEAEKWKRAARKHEALWRGLKRNTRSLQDALEDLLDKVYEWQDEEQQLHEDHKEK